MNKKTLSPRFLAQLLTTLISVVLAVAAAWFIWTPADAVDAARLQAFAGGVASVAGSLFGFVLAAMSILIASDRLVIRNMRVTGHFAILHANMLWAAGLLAATFLLAIGLIVVPPAATEWMARLTAGIAVLAACATVFAGRRFLLVVNTLARSDH